MVDPKQRAAKQEEAKRTWLLWIVFGVGALCVLPFIVALFRLLDFCGTHSVPLGLYAAGLNAALAIAFGGIVLCVLLLFYRLRNEETSPSLTSGVVVIAIGAAMAVAIAIAARNQADPPAGVNTASH
jgi:multisubunit Na+/H+ antiporter MnhB subunit